MYTAPTAIQVVREARKIPKRKMTANKPPHSKIAGSDGDCFCTIDDTLKMYVMRSFFAMWNHSNKY
jgi:hypothetical protein